MWSWRSVKQWIFLGTSIFALNVVFEVQARDMSGRMGIGAESSLGFHTNPDPTTPGLSDYAGSESFDVPGFSVVYQTTEILAFQIITSFQMTTAKDRQGGATYDFSVMRWGSALRAIVATGLTDDVNLGLFGGMVILHRTASADPSGFDESALHLSFEIGMRPEYFITDHFSIHTQIGITLSILNSGNSDYSQGGMNINIFQNGDLLGNAGFTFWF